MKSGAIVDARASDRVGADSPRYTSGPLRATGQPSRDHTATGSRCTSGGTIAHVSSRHRPSGLRTQPVASSSVPAPCEPTIVIRATLWRGQMFVHDNGV